MCLKKWTFLAAHSQNLSLNQQTLKGSKLASWVYRRNKRQQRLKEDETAEDGAYSCGNFWIFWLQTFKNRNRIFFENQQLASQRTWYLSHILMDFFSRNVSKRVQETCDRSDELAKNWVVQQDLLWMFKSYWSIRNRFNQI